MRDETEKRMTEALSTGCPHRIDRDPTSCIQCTAWVLEMGETNAQQPCQHPRLCECPHHADGACADWANRRDVMVCSQCYVRCAGLN